MNEEFWEQQQKEYLAQFDRLSLLFIGLYMFEVQGAYKPTHKRFKPRKNKEYDPEAPVFNYKKRIIKVHSHYWNRRPFEDKAATTEISEKVWKRIMVLSLELKQNKIPQPRYILYWKKDNITVWFCFITMEHWLRIKPVVNAYDYKDKEQMAEIKKLVHWSGYGTKRDFPAMKSYYENECKEG